MRDRYRASKWYPIENPTGNVYDFAEVRIQRIRVIFDRDEALEAAGLE